MPHYTLAAVLVAALAVIACGATDPADAALLELTVTQVDPDTRMVTGVVRNVGDVELYHGPCFAQLQYQQSGHWVPGEPDQICPLPLLTLRPGAEAEFTVGPAAGATDCGYRVVASVHASMGSEGAGERVESTTEPFCLD